MSDAPVSGAAAVHTPRRPALERLPLLLLGFIALFVGTGAGLARFAWPMPDVAAGAAAWHGPLMICGFFGVVISLERAVALGRGWAYAAPLFAGLGTAALLHGGTAWAPLGYLAGSIVLLVATLAVLRRQREGFVVVLAAAAACWTVGTALWAGGAAVHEVVAWWLAFLVLTIAGERLELSRFMPPSPLALRTFTGIVAVLGFALLPSLAPGRPAVVWGLHVFGAALLALAGWLLRHDIARRTVRQRGLTRYIAVCLLSGYGWLALGAAIVALSGLQPGTASYDAALHALLLGFVFSMVFGHAPIIFPAVLRVAVPYHPVFYAPLALLQASLALRLACDAVGALAVTRWGALGSALALLAFVVVMATAVLTSSSARPRRRAR
jgi:hypothetical protein